MLSALLSWVRGRSLVVSKSAFKIHFPCKIVLPSDMSMAAHSVLWQAQSDAALAKEHSRFYFVGLFCELYPDVF